MKMNQAAQTKKDLLEIQIITVKNPPKSSMAGFPEELVRTVGLDDRSGEMG